MCFFRIDEKPTGSKDPYALRRAALGVIRLILENRVRLPLRALLESAKAGIDATLVKRGSLHEDAERFAYVFDHAPDSLQS